VLVDAAADVRQNFRHSGKPARLARFAHALPIGVIAILQAPGGVAADRLDVSVRLGGV
jgi:hypothetical protein